MTLSQVTARQLCTKSELALFSDSLSRNVKALDEKQLQSRVARARRLRDKYRQRANRQDRESLGKQSPRRGRPAQGSVATRKKEQLFSETLDRFGRRLQQLRSQESQAQPTRETGEKKGTAKPGRSKRAKKTIASKPKHVAKKSSTNKEPKGAVEESVVRIMGTTATKTKRRPNVAARQATAAAKQARLRASGRKRIQRHVAAENRRRQARRDAR